MAESTVNTLMSSPSTQKKYNILLIDPPWSYKDKANSGERGVQYKYPTMSDKELLLLPINEIAANDSLLFLWATFPRLEFAIQLMKAWGFEYKTVGFLWCKKNKKSDSWFWGMGNWSRANAEICLMGVKGKPKRKSPKVHQLVTARIGEHSAKPPEVRDRIVELCGDLPRIEIFARERTPGWDVIGNAIDGQDIRESLIQLL